jgi:hypothetical protein
MIRQVSPDLLRDIILGIAEDLPSGLKVRPGDILVDIPLKKRLRDAYLGEEATTESMDTPADAGSRPTMWVHRRSRSGPEKWQDLFHYSPLAGLLGKVEDHSGRKVRVFMSRELLSVLPSGFEEALPHHIRGILTEVVRS